MPDIRTILDPLRVDEAVKAQAWDDFNEAKDEKEFRRRFNNSTLPDDAKAALWDAKFARSAASKPERESSLPVVRPTDTEAAYVNAEMEGRSVKMPPAAPVPLPAALRPNGRVESPAFQLAADTGEALVSPVIEGIERVNTGVNRIAGRFPWSQGASERYARGASEVLRGGGEAALPLIGAGIGSKFAGTAATEGVKAAAVPVAKAVGAAGAGLAAQFGVEKAAESAGVQEGAAMLAGDAASVLPFMKAARFLRGKSAPEVPPVTESAPPKSAPSGSAPPQQGRQKLPLKDRPPIEDQTFGDTGKEDVSTFYNVDRLNIPEAGKQAIKAEIDGAHRKLFDVVGQRLTHKEVIDYAQKTSDVLGRTVTREETLAKEAANLNLRQKIAEAGKTGKVDAEFIDLWMKDKAAGEDIARQLRARAIHADPNDKPILNQILDGVLQQNSNADEVFAAAKDVNFNDPEQATTFYRQFVKPKASEWVDLLRYNSMLSSPNTHLNNIFSNWVGSAIVAPIEKAIAGGIDAAASKIGNVAGAKTSSYGLNPGFEPRPRTRFAGEAVPYMRGYAENAGKAARNFVNVMRGSQMMNQPDVNRIPLTVKGSFLRPVERSLDVPMRALEAADQFFTALTEGGERKALEYSQRKGVAVSDVEGTAKNVAAQRLFRGQLGGEDQGYLLHMIDTGANMLNSMRNSKNPLARNVSKFALPFVKTPTNLVKQGIEYSPAGILGLPGNTNKTQQLAKIAIGTATATGVALLNGTDRLTWEEPVDEKGRQQFREAGRIPYAVRIGDTWVQYSRLHPAMAFNFALVASIKDKMARGQMSDDVAENVLSIFARHANFVANQSYMKAVGDIVGTAKGSASGLANFLANPVQQLIPYRALLSYVERLTDPVQRQADPTGSLLERQMQTIIAQLPGFASKGVPGLRDVRPQAFGPIPPRLDSKSNPIPNRYPWLNAVSPVRISPVQETADQDYQSAIAIKGESAKARKVGEKEREAAEQIYGAAKQQPTPQEAQKVLGELAAQKQIGPAGKRHIVNLAKKQRLNMTEDALVSAPVEVRAEVLVEKLDALQRDDKAKLMRDWIRKSIVTRDVLKTKLFQDWIQAQADSQRQSQGVQ
ncbi:MAG TPA: hypothetical protein VM120_05335 [Bryobacteraceae bacterium]|nr:hypothetical protein [Bryobacteraceae bacterium]